MEHKIGVYENYIKRILDIILSGLAIFVLSPVLLILGVLVRVKLGSPILFSQDRPGKNERIFKLYKFRTMTDERDENGNLLPDEVRLTKFGRLLRSTSLDELPELWNIFKGDMSIVGPRPLLVRYLPRYNEEQKHRHDVRPGLTGWAQINGRDELPIDVKAGFDGEYVRRMSFAFDVKCIIGTVTAVFGAKGVKEGRQ